MNYADIKSVDIQDGTGVRVSIYVSGCHFHCKGCHNKEAWDFNYGKKFDDKTIDFIIGEMDHDYISGLSILGGEPLELENQKELVKLVEKKKKKYPKKDIWCYTGYKFKEDVLGNMYKKYDFTKNFLKNIDIIVDGQFIEEKKLVDLKFRGSTNQKKIDVKESLKKGKEVCLKFGDEERYEKEIDDPKAFAYKKFEIEDSGIKEEPIFDEKIIDFKVPEEKEISTYKIKEPEEKIAASGITNDEQNNL